MHFGVWTVYSLANCMILGVWGFGVSSAERWGGTKLTDSEKAFFLPTPYPPPRNIEKIPEMGRLKNAHD